MIGTSSHPLTLAVVILNYNGRNFLEKFLPAVLKYSPKDSVVVVDNASTDSSVAFLHESFPDIRIVQNKSNKGFAAGYNEGLACISADVYCLLNSDVEVTPHWTVAPLQALENDAQIAAVQPKIRSYHDKDYFEFAGAAGGLLDHLGYPYCRGRIFDQLEKDRGQYNHRAEIFWASGCAMFIRSKDFWNVGGFDERFFAHQEEIDLCWRLRHNNRLVMYVPESMVFHVGGGTLNKQSPFKTYLNFRNNLTMLVKNLPSNKVLPIVFMRLLLDGLAAVYMGFKDGPAHFLAVLRAHFSFYRMLPKTLKLRPTSASKDYFQRKWVVKEILASRSRRRPRK
ncbi:glycosyltransferase family 2 protein [Planobacterium oryzisoli]|uniref:Glycosyltransferase family 2 protein n=1 Tax=Planobacterium oryzisoli TaxID=2771435 RepID=A0A931E666_9FLAO|nr:glycosyltransferase family 2 protein [Planobacterium oryzisoli]MBF5027425.1 glycosyltransferase family 2 protein [Planobacterium oryzisoli]